MHTAHELLVADADERSVGLTGEARSGLLDDPMVPRALALEELLRTRSPFALVRAVELAEQIMSNGQHVWCPARQGRWEETVKGVQVGAIPLKEPKRAGAPVDEAGLNGSATPLLAKSLASVSTRPDLNHKHFELLRNSNYRLNGHRRDRGQKRRA